MSRLLLALLIFLPATSFASIDNLLTGEDLIEQIKFQQNVMGQSVFQSDDLILYPVESEMEITQEKILGGYLILMADPDRIVLPFVKIQISYEGTVINETSTNEGGHWRIPADGLEAGIYKITAILESEKWKITNGSRTYGLELGNIDYDGDLGVILVSLILEDVPIYQAAAIHNTASHGFKVLQENGINIDWWNKLDINWPATGDYYSRLSGVHITEGLHWDVVGHEIGHAVFDMASRGVMGGGQHYIDQCYNTSLAFSEGWASFYSAFTQINRDNPDPHFEFMVARRAPLEIEHIPSDVCAGDTNEWRVYAALWDLYDSYEGDDDQFEMSLIAHWNAFTGPSHMRGFEDFIKLNLFPLIETPESQEEVLRVLRENTIEF